MASENGSWSKRDRNELLHLRQLVTQPTDTFSEAKWETYHHLHIVILGFLFPMPIQKKKGRRDTLKKKDTDKGTHTCKDKES